MTTMCSSCGGSLHEEDDFCTNCGHPRGAEPAADEEEILAVLPNVRYRKGLLGLGSTMNILVITRQALLVVKTPAALELQISEMDDELLETCREGLQDDHGFMKAHDFSNAPWQIYARRPLKESLEENADNLLIETSLIRKVEVAMHDGWKDDTLRVYLHGETLKFEFWWPLGEIALEALRKALGDKVRDVS